MKQTKHDYKRDCQCYRCKGIRNGPNAKYLHSRAIWKQEREARQARQTRPPRYYSVNPVTQKMEEVFPESEIPADALVIPMYWAGDRYVTVPGTEFYGPVPEAK